MKLPFEIICLIIRHTTDRHTLTGWACVSWAARAEAERYLWRSIIVNRRHFDSACCERIDGILDPIGTLMAEALQDRELQRLLRDARQDSMPLYRRAPFVERISLEARPPSNSYGWLKHQGFEYSYVISMFKWLSPFMANLRSVHLCAHVTKEAWDAVIALPALRKLHLVRTLWMTYDELDFHGLCKLEEFVCGTCRQEAASLGKAVRDSNLAKLRIVAIGRTEGYPVRQDTLKNFFGGLTAADESGALSSTYGDGNSGFPSSLVVLEIEKGAECAVSPPVSMHGAFRRCNKLKRLHLDAFDSHTLVHLLPDLNLPVLKYLHLPSVMDKPYAYWGGQPETDTLVDFVERHLKSLKRFRLSDTGSTPGYVHELDRRLEEWFTGGGGYYSRKLK